MSQDATKVEDWKKCLPLQKCSKCTVPLIFGRNIDTDKTGPCDARATVYVMRKGDAFSSASAGRQIPVQTFENFRKTIKRIELADGTVLGPDDLRAFVSHFNTCPSADYFSRRAKS